MYAPTRAQTRAFFVDTWRKHGAGSVLLPLEAIALEWMQRHPEYAPAWEADDATVRDYAVEDGQANPFLHLALHLALSEQVAIDQPPGIRAAFEQLAARAGDAHAAAHVAIECLAQMVWEAQRGGASAPSTAALGAQYVDCVRRSATRT